MSVISTNDVTVALKKGSTWGTEADITSGGLFLYASNISVSGGYTDFIPRDFGLAGKRTSTARLQGKFNVKITCDLTYGQAWLALFASVMGTESSPSETTVGEADYLVNHDLADSVTGLFWTLCYKVETDRVFVLPSVKIMGFSLSISNNGAGSITFDGEADVITESSANTVAEIAALTKYTYETVTLGGANHYFRTNADSGGGLSGSDDKMITGVTISVSRPLRGQYGLRGASSKYVLEPLQYGDIEGTLKVDYIELDDATYDMFGEWEAATTKKAELFIDGSQIAGGVNRSLKFQMPYLKPKPTIPVGHDVQSNNSQFTPSIEYHMLKRSAAPTGMSGVTDYLRLAEIHPTRSTKWTA